MQGFAAGWITDTPGVSVNDALRLAGNSVNPYQAVAALRWLLSQLDAERAA
jgi:DNA (cytosine-5)-methyltransferase 1